MRALLFSPEKVSLNAAATRRAVSGALSRYAGALGLEPGE